MHFPCQKKIIFPYAFYMPTNKVIKKINNLKIIKYKNPYEINDIEFNKKYFEFYQTDFKIQFVQTNFMG